MPQDNILIGQIIKEQRKRLKLTQFELAEKVGMHEKQISRIEAGQNYPTFDNFIKIINILGLSMSDFDSGNDGGKIKRDLMFIINNSSPAELSAYLDILTSINKHYSK